MDRRAGGPVFYKVLCRNDLGISYRSGGSGCRSGGNGSLPSVPQSRRGVGRSLRGGTDPLRGGTDPLRGGDGPLRGAAGRLPSAARPLLGADNPLPIRRRPIVRAGGAKSTIHPVRAPLLWPVNREEEPVLPDAMRLGALDLLPARAHAIAQWRTRIISSDTTVVVLANAASSAAPTRPWRLSSGTRIGPSSCSLRELERLGWIYVPRNEACRNGESQLKWDDALALLQTLTLPDSPVKESQ